MAANPAIPFEETFDATYGLEIVSVSEEQVTGRVPVRNGIKQPMGLVHGGIYASAAEALASMATFAAVHEEGNVAMGMSNNTTFLRPITEGNVNITARPLQKGRTTWVWDVDCRNDEGKLCATSRVTIAVRPARPRS